MNVKYISYEKHKDNLRDHLKNAIRGEHAKTWLNKDTVDAWRHFRMYSLIDPLLQSDMRAKWITIGDGRLGNDAHYIQEKGIDVLATDVADDLLKEAKELRYINKFKSENAESLSFVDDEFDYVFCKEALHHFPRPVIAVYEMLRVARKAVILIEPNDSYVDTDKFVMRRLRGIIKFTLRIKDNKGHEYEKVGNYKYAISKRELEKIALGIDIRVLAFNYLNDFYINGVEYEKANESSKLLRTLQNRIFLLNLLCKLRITDYNILAAIIFKIPPDDGTKVCLQNAGYEFAVFDGNPYLNK